MQQSKADKDKEGGAAHQNLSEKHSVPSHVRDYSKTHHVVDKEFAIPTPHTPEEWNKYKLSEEQILSFKRDGYLLGIPVLTEQQVDRLLQELATFAEYPNKVHEGHGLFHEFHANESNDPNNVLLHCLGAWRITPAFHDVIFHPAVAVASSQLLGGAAVRLWHDQLFAKPPKFGGCVAWHQDYSYWTRTESMAHLTIHIALDDQSPENGCLHYVPGSHLWYEKPLPITDRHFGDMDSIQTVLNDDQKKSFKPVPMLLKKGQACIHHPLTVHGSFANKSNGPRRATVVNVIADGVHSVTNEPLLDGVPIYPPGKKLEGQFFPMLYDPTNPSYTNSTN